jgi:hypothetical protein
MNRGKQPQLLALAAAVVNETLCHSATSEATSHLGLSISTPDHDAIVHGLKRHIRPRPQTNLITKILRDDYLPLGAHALSHTTSV